MDGKDISSRAFSKCELHVEIDGNELNIPINFGMTDEEVRKIYPYLLTVSSVENNPMTGYVALKESGKLDEYPDELRTRYETWAKRMSKYWYDKPTTSLLDVAIGLAIDMKYHGTMLGDIIDPPETAYDGFMENPMNPDPDLITEDEVAAIEEKYNIKGVLKSSAESVGSGHGTMAGNIGPNVNDLVADDNSVFAELDGIEAEAAEQTDIFAAIIEDDYNAADKSRYEMTYEKGKRFSDDRISKDGILRLYNENNMFDKVEREMLGVSPEPEPKDSVPLENIVPDDAYNIVSMTDDDDDSEGEWDDMDLDEDEDDDKYTGSDDV